MKQKKNSTSGVCYCKSLLGLSAAVIVFCIWFMTSPSYFAKPIYVSFTKTRTSFNIEKFKQYSNSEEVSVRKVLQKMENYKRKLEISQEAWNNGVIRKSIKTSKRPLLKNSDDLESRKQNLKNLSKMVSSRPKNVQDLNNLQGKITKQTDEEFRQKAMLSKAVNIQEVTTKPGVTYSTGNTVIKRRNVVYVHNGQNESLFYMGQSKSDTSVLVNFTENLNNSNFYQNKNNYDQDDQKYGSYQENYLQNLINFELDDSLDAGFESYNQMPPDNKLILLYSRLWHEYEWAGIPVDKASNITNYYKCPIHQCTFTYNRMLFNNSKMVVFHLADEKENGYFLNSLNKLVGRTSNQKWALLTSENPVSFNTPTNMDKFDHLFNLTITYDRKSDIYLPYGKYRQISQREKPPKMKNFARGRQNAAAWFVSNCDILLRNQAVQVIEKYLPVYVGGRCSKKYERQIYCKKTDSLSNLNECAKKIKRFKFYLAFESGFCNDYVTEKYWENAIENDVLPIVLNGANNSDILIPNSYIDMQNFKTLDDLGKYLKYVASNDREYNKYFKWKSKYKTVKRLEWPYPDELVCNLCKKAHEIAPKKTLLLSEFWNDKKCDGNRSKKILSLLYQDNKILHKSSHKKDFSKQRNEFNQQNSYKVSFYAKSDNNFSSK